MEMLGDQDTCITHVKTVEFVEFLVLTLELWDPQESQVDTADVNVNQATGECQALLHSQEKEQQVQTQNLGVTVLVIQTGQQAADRQDSQVTVETGQNAVLEATWADQDQ